MSKWLKRIRSNKIVTRLASLKITVICLLLLFVLTFWGTVAQVENGLYASQERYFSSFYFLAAGFIPFPGAQLVLWILGVNLVCALFITKKFYIPKFAGLLITHCGLILFLIAGYVTFVQSRESHLTLREGQAANVSQAYHDWEVAVWPNSDEKARTVTAISTKRLKEGEVITFAPLEVSFAVKTFHRNARAFTAPFAGVKEKYLNASGINILEAKPAEKEPEKNVPAVILQAQTPEKPLLLLFGGEDEPTKFTAGDKEFFFILRHEKYPLPATIKLIDFMMEKHPGTEVARTYKSKVEVQSHGASRDVTISMNEPLRIKEYTFYQSSYQIDPMGNETSTLAVVKNSGRLLPYIATFVVTIGLALHFLLAAFGAFKIARSND